MNRVHLIKMSEEPYILHVKWSKTTREPPPDAPSPRPSLAWRGLC